MTDQLLYEDGTRRNKFMIKLSEFKGRHLLDIRNWYFDQKTDEYKSTRKGVALTLGKFDAVYTIMSRYHDTIRAWLTEPATANHVDEQNRYSETAAFARQPISAVTEAVGRQSNFFYVEHQGGIDKIIFNEDHPFTQRLTDIMGDESDDEYWELVKSLCMSYERSRRRLEGQTVQRPEALFDLLESNWSRFLKEYMV